VVGVGIVIYPCGYPHFSSHGDELSNQTR
jgi:hypothetical protein